MWDLSNAIMHLAITVLRDRLSLVLVLTTMLSLVLTFFTKWLHHPDLYSLVSGFCIHACMCASTYLKIVHCFLSTWGVVMLEAKKKKQSKQVTKSFQLKTSTCRDGTLKNQPNMKIGTIPQYFYYYYTQLYVTCYTQLPYGP